MTLLLNEIYMETQFRNSFIVAAADRRISKPDGNPDHPPRMKLFKIPHLNATVSYFGLAEVFPRRPRMYLSDWLRDFLRHSSLTSGLDDFAHGLRDELNRVVPTNFLRNYPSGFHISGFDNEQRPDFWFFSNIGNMDEYRYTQLQSRYSEPRSHFLGRDAREHFEWDGEKSINAGAWVYRNGDIRSQVVAWEHLDEILFRLSQLGDFQIPSNPEDYQKYVKFKFEILAYFYKHWATRKIIARPIDVFVLKPEV